MLRRYPHRLERPLKNGYGMIFATRLAMRDGRIESIVRPDTPSAHAALTAKAPFRVIALHPRPPVPGRDSDSRDAEIAVAARRVAREQLPVLAIGDFNDVAWSHTSQLFKRIGGYLDPRVGRGTYPPFPAWAPILGWPLDQLFVTPEFEVRSINVLENVGSDHLPIHAELCLAGATTGSADPKPVSQENREDVREIINAYEGDRGED
ncbi:endonuclease/exonuclease/phosphatase family protein [Sphingomonas sp. RS6]